MPDDKEHTYSAEEAQLLKETGYEVTLKREFSFWTAFGVAFVIISPIVALYGVFGLGLVTGGPAFWWTFPLTLIGQLLTALVFAELGSRYPLAGGVYQWTRQAGNPRLAWFTGWSYIWCYVISITAATFIMANYFCAMIGYNNPPVPAPAGCCSRS